MSRSDNPESGLSVSEKPPINLLAIRMYLEAHPGADLRIIEKKTGESYILSLNSRQDVCFMRGNSSLLILGREDDFELVETSWRLVEGSRTATEMEAAGPTIPGRQRMSNDEILAGLTRMCEDRHKDIARIGRLELYAKPRKRLIMVYQAIRNNDGEELDIQKIGKGIRQGTPHFILRFSWYHRNSHMALEMKKKLDELDFPTSRDGNYLSFEGLFTESEIEYACKNTSLKDYMED